VAQQATPADWGKYFFQTANIDASATSTWNGGAGFSPIGNATTKFSGWYDGKDFTINGLTINRPTTDYVGLFGYTAANSRVQYILLNNVSIVGRDFVGGLVGYSQSYKYSNYTTGSVTGNSNCGGMVGYQNTCGIYYSYSTCSVTGTSDVGGLVGVSSSTYISQCYSSGAVSGSTNTGGLVGSNAGGIINESFWDKETSAQNLSAGGTGKTTAEMKTKSTFTSANWNFNFARPWIIYPNINNGYPAFHFQTESTPPFSGGDGSEGNPYQIANLADLEHLSVYQIYWNKSYHFVQTADIDATETQTWNVGNHDYNAGTPDVAMGFTTIGNYSVAFIGTYNGNGHSISNIYINLPYNDNLGLFAQIANNSAIKNLTVSGNITGYYNIGVLVGTAANSTISNCKTMGTVNGIRNLGGLIGSMYLTTVEKCASNSEITATEVKAGGLVGTCTQGTLSYCYATGNVSGNQYIGGFIGVDNESTVVSYCYSTGTVTGTLDVGGFIGYVYNTNLSNCFWDSEASGLSTSAGGTLSTSFYMKRYSFWKDINWDFTTPIWVQNNDHNNSYPMLAWEGVAHNATYQVFSGGDGTELNPYQISNLNDLHYLSSITAHWSSYYIQTADIDATETQTWNVGDHDADAGTPNEPMGFLPIGGFYGAFFGSYNGNGFTISNLYINRPKTDYVGLFGYNMNAKPYTKIGIVNCNITGKNNVGAIAGASDQGAFTECYATGTVKGASTVGGLVGLGGFSFTKCYCKVCRQ